MSLFRKITQLFSGKVPVESTQGVQVYDLRSTEDRAIAQRAHTGDSLGPGVDTLVTELVEIGSRDAFLTVGPNRENVRDPRTQEVGRLLAARGGKALMKAAYYRVEARCGSTLAGHLSIAWDGIGGWMK